VYLGLVIAAGSVILFNGIVALEHAGLDSLPLLLCNRAHRFGNEGDITDGSRNHLDELSVRADRDLHAEPAETLAMGCLGMLVQSVFHAKSRPGPSRMIFNVASMACAIEAAYDVYHAPWLQNASLEAPLRLLLAAGVFFRGEYAFGSGCHRGHRRQERMDGLARVLLLVVPELPGRRRGGLGGRRSQRLVGWQTALLLLPVLYVVYRSLALYVNRLEDEKKRAEQQRVHAEEVAALHRRTIETLALAIEAKDQTTHYHLERVEIYAIAVGQELGLDEAQIEALRAASLLHDIGKLAVPEYIISKPGKLTPQEFEKMKTHTVVGAEIVERIRFRIRSHPSCARITRNGTAPVIRMVSWASRFLSARGFFPRWIAWTRWRPIGNTGVRSRSRKPCKSCVRKRARASTRRSSRFSRGARWNWSRRRSRLYPRTCQAFDRR
jgi:putative nucleotidyltransferase with HDIG domain